MNRLLVADYEIKTLVSMYILALGLINNSVVLLDLRMHVYTVDDHQHHWNFLAGFLELCYAVFSRRAWGVLLSSWSRVLFIVGIYSSALYE